MRNLDTKLYCLSLNKSTPPTWEVVKTAMKPPGREYHAGVLYKDKYYVTGGNSGLLGYDLTKDTWVLNMSSHKWAMLQDGPVERFCHGMWAVNDTLYVLGGRRLHMDVLGFYPERAPYTLERFISYDIKSKSWSEEPIIGSRPFDISEFTVLPLFNNDSQNDDASSVIIWGGYHEFQVDGPAAVYTNEATLKPLYGEEWREFKTQYVSRLLRFYPDTMAFVKLRPTVNLLPKAQSFGAELSTQRNCLELIIGGGYGFTGESIASQIR